MDGKQTNSHSRDRGFMPKMLFQVVKHITLCVLRLFHVIIVLLVTSVTHITSFSLSAQWYIVLQYDDTDGW